MNRLRIKYPKDFTVAPMSYLISEELDSFEADRQHDPEQLWILKPVAASCGRGIKLVNGTQRVPKREGILACKYVANPHLLNGLKYDLRIYVLVTSFNPLRVYIYNDGLVRFATEKYTLDPKNLNKKYVHLTNFSINKKNEKFVKNNDRAGEEEGENEGGINSSKWDFKMLKDAYAKIGVSY